MKLIQFNIPKHTYGRSFSFDLPNSTMNEYCVGAFAIANNLTIYNADGTKNEFSPFGTLAIASLSTDGERIIHPSLPVLAKQPFKAVANSLTQPVDFARLGNKLTLVLDEDGIAELTAEEVSYTISVYVSTIKITNDKKRTACYRR